MAAIVEERQKSAVETGERTDCKNDGQHEKRAASERADVNIDASRNVDGRMQRIGDGVERADIEHDTADQDGIIDELAAVPLDRAKTCAHRTTSASACGGISGGGRSASANAKPSPIASA